MIPVTDYQIDGIRELVNIGVGRAAGMLNQMLNEHIELQVPYVKVFQTDGLRESVELELGSELLSAVQLAFRGTIAGSASLVFPPDSAAKLVGLLTNEQDDSTDLDAIRTGTLTEVGNIILNGVMGSFSNVLHCHLMYAVPIYMEDRVVALIGLDGGGGTTVLAHTHFLIRKYQIHGDILLLFEVDSFKTLVDSIDQVN